MKKLSRNHARNRGLATKDISTIVRICICPGSHLVSNIEWFRFKWLLNLLSFLTWSLNVRVGCEREYSSQLYQLPWNVVKMINIFHQPKFSLGIRRTGRPTYTLEIFCVTRSLRSRASSQALYVYFSEKKKKNVWKAISELYWCKIFLEPGWDGGGSQKGPAWG